MDFLGPVLAWHGARREGRCESEEFLEGDDVREARIMEDTRTDRRFAHASCDENKLRLCCQPHV